ncbi:MAG: hypothetical protein LUE27_09530 [Clostridia bacterium]|nr:hypothetical protein [Clostridia bacterium]
MKKSILGIFALAFAMCVAVCSCSDKGGSTPESGSSTDENFTVYKVGDVLGAWEEGCLDIHFINTGRGESSFLIFPDGTTMIIDFAGCTTISDDEEDNSPQTPFLPSADISTQDVIVNYINHFTSEVSRGHIDYALLSHMHDDHWGTYNSALPKGGDGTFVLNSLCGVGVALPFGHYLDRGYPDYNFPKALTGAKYENLRNFLTWSKSTNGTTVEQFNPGALNQIALVHDAASYPDFQIQNLTCSGYYWTGTGENYELYIPETYDNSDAYPNENNLCCAFWLRFGKFDYYTGGDHQYNGKSTYSYKDSELPMSQVIGVMDVNKANHHGTNYCNSEEFMDATCPTVWIANPWRDVQPNGTSVTRVRNANPLCSLYATNFGANCTASASDFVSTQGHVVVRVDPTATKYYVYVLEDSDMSYVVKNVKSYACK